MKGIQILSGFSPTQALSGFVHHSSVLMNRVTTISLHLLAINRHIQMADKAKNNPSGESTVTLGQTRILLTRLSIELRQISSQVEVGTS